MSMLLRRRLMEVSSVTPAPGGLGEFSKGYATTLTPNSQTEWVIQHNLGVTPKVVIVEIAGTPSLTSYAKFVAYELDAENLQNDYTGFMAYIYSNNGSDATNQKMINSSTSYVQTTTTTVTLIPPQGNQASPWDTGTTYNVRIYG